MLRRYWDANIQHPFAADGIQPSVQHLPFLRRVEEDHVFCAHLAPAESAPRDEIDSMLPSQP
jgi:hypothetical protein